MDAERASKKDRSSKHSSSSSSSKKSSKNRHRNDKSPSPPRLDESFKRKNLGDSDEERRRKSSNRDRDSKKHRHDSERREKESSRSEEQSTSSNGGAGNDELSIQETNKLREKLGLKPLQTTDPNKPTETKTASGEIKKTYLDADTNQVFEHAPAKNMVEIKEQKELREKLKNKREQRELTTKILKSKGIADSDEEADAASWLQKVKEKQEAQKKAKLLEEMDKQFENDELVEAKKTGKQYDSGNLKGLRVEHDTNLFQEGKEVILTLKDRSILQGSGADLDVDNDEDADVLINVNIADDERFKKNVENKKQKPGYSAYEEFDEEGLFKEKSILDKYNEELNGEVKKSFRLGDSGTYDASDEKFLQRLEDEHKAKAIRIGALNELKAETDYFTQTELEKFKKPKKIRKVLRKGKKDKMIKADDLLPLPTETPDADVAASKRKRVKEEDGWVQEDPTIPVSTVKSSKAKSVSLKDIDFGFDKEEEKEEGDSDSKSDDSESDEDGGIRLNQEEWADYKEMADEEENALEELQSILSKTRQKVTAKTSTLDEIVKLKEEVDPTADERSTTDGVAFDALNMDVEVDDNIYLDSMSEFCKNVGQVSTREDRSRALDDEEDDEDEDEDEDEANGEVRVNKDQQPVTSKKKTSKSDSEDGEEFMEDEDYKNQSNNSDKPKNKVESDEEFELLDDEPHLDRGLASFLSLCKNKGFIEAEKKTPTARAKKDNIQAQNYMVEEKNYYDIDDKYNRNRDRFGGPTVDFHEKSNYKPSVKIDYTDEKGHHMNEKEAFRYLSHKFHGKGSGKRKTEKQQKKYMEKDIMAKMSLTDTPLNTVAMLVDKQKKLQQPYVVLSATKNKEQVTLNKR